ncbi:MAG: outer membrane protein assembly factor BamB family protein [Prosthecobacter sp.]
MGELRCLAVADGQLKWRVNFTKDFHAEVPAEKGLAKGAQRHGFTAAPWVDGERLIALVGNTNGAGMVCFDKITGKVLWQSLTDRAANAAPDHRADRRERAQTSCGLHRGRFDRSGSSDG